MTRWKKSTLRFNTYALVADVCARTWFYGSPLYYWAVEGMSDATDWGPLSNLSEADFEIDPFI